jgi:hypothetical protein
VIGRSEFEYKKLFFYDIFLNEQYESYFFAPFDCNLGFGGLRVQERGKDSAAD